MAYNSYFEKLFRALSDEYYRLVYRGETFLPLEKNSLTTLELIPAHENDLGIPEEGLSVGVTNVERRNEIRAKLLLVGGTGKQYLTDVAEAVGYKIYIGEYTPSWVGEMICGEPIATQKMIFYFVVGVLPNNSINLLEVLQSIINIFKPAHTRALYSFFGAEFDRAFDDSFDHIKTGGYDYWGGAFSLAFDSSFNVNLDTILPEEVSNGGEFNWAFSTDFDGFHYVTTN